jgi:hypothetical protein
VGQGWHLLGMQLVSAANWSLVNDLFDLCFQSSVIVGADVTA